MQPPPVTEKLKVNLVDPGNSKAVWHMSSGAESGDCAGGCMQKSQCWTRRRPISRSRSSARRSIISSASIDSGKRTKSLDDRSSGIAWNQPWKNLPRTSNCSPHLVHGLTFSGGVARSGGRIPHRSGCDYHQQIDRAHAAGGTFDFATKKWKKLEKHSRLIKPTSETTTGAICSIVIGADKSAVRAIAYDTTRSAYTQYQAQDYFPLWIQKRLLPGTLPMIGNMIRLSSVLFLSRTVSYAQVIYFMIL